MYSMSSVAQRMGTAAAAGKRKHSQLLIHLGNSCQENRGKSSPPFYPERSGLLSDATCGSFQTSRPQARLLVYVFDISVRSCCFCVVKCLVTQVYPVLLASLFGQFGPSFSFPSPCFSLSGFVIEFSLFLDF